MLHWSMTEEAATIEIEMLTLSSYSTFEYLQKLGEDPYDVAPLTVILQR